MKQNYHQLNVELHNNNLKTVGNMVLKTDTVLQCAKCVKKCSAFNNYKTYYHSELLLK